VSAHLAAVPAHGLPEASRCANRRTRHQGQYDSSLTSVRFQVLVGYSSDNNRMEGLEGRKDRMKRKVIAALMGMAVSTSAFAQGHILISNYLTPPYNQVYWDPGISGIGNQAVTQTSVPLQIWFGDGVISDPDLLIPGVTFTVDPGFGFDPGAGHGPGGYFGAQTQVLPAWNEGDIYTFQLRVVSDVSFPVIPPYYSFVRSVLWTEQGSIRGIALPANTSMFCPGLVIPVPEPSTFWLAFLGATLMLHRRLKK
jgi:hypothetical protein